MRDVAPAFSFIRVYTYLLESVIVSFVREAHSSKLNLTPLLRRTLLPSPTGGYSF